MWTFNGKEVRSIKDMPKGTIGFIYKIVNETNDRFYIGKKDLYHVTNPEISKKKYDELKAAGEPVTRTKNKAKSKPGKPVWRYKRKNHTKETNWATYNGSNDQLNMDVNAGHSIQKVILKYCSSKKELTMREVEAQFKAEVLDRCDSYNGNILAKFFKQVKC